MEQFQKEVYFNFKLNVSVAENSEEKISIQLYDNKYFYGNFNSNFSLQNKQLKRFVEVAENAEKKISIELYNNKSFLEILIQIFLFKIRNFNKYFIYNFY